MEEDRSGVREGGAVRLIIALGLYTTEGVPMSIWLVMQAADGHERSFAVHKPTTIIGRETTCDVRVPIPTVSQKHCQITFDGSELKLLDLRSDQGTFHNGNRVDEAVLSHEDKLTVGPVTFVVRVQQDVEALNGHSGVPEIIIERHDGLIADELVPPAGTAVPFDGTKDLSAG
jgi:pSer/pThr/pTyr-binding forkhead associated (FHA) protein